MGWHIFNFNLQSIPTGYPVKKKPRIISIRSYHKKHYPIMDNLFISATPVSTCDVRATVC